MYIDLEVVKIDKESDKNLADVMTSLAVCSGFQWDTGYDIAGCSIFFPNGETRIPYINEQDEYRQTYSVYNRTSGQFEGHSPNRWDNYEEDIKAIAKKFPAFEFYYYIESKRIMIYAQDDIYDCREYITPTPKERWECQENK